MQSNFYIRQICRQLIAIFFICIAINCNYLNDKSNSYYSCSNKATQDYVKSYSRKDISKLNSMFGQLNYVDFNVKTDRPIYSKNDNIVVQITFVNTSTRELFLPPIDVKAIMFSGQDNGCINGIDIGYTISPMEIKSEKQISNNSIIDYNRNKFCFDKIDKGESYSLKFSITNRCDAGNGNIRFYLSKPGIFSTNGKSLKYESEGILKIKEIYYETK